ncbi:FAKD4 protein, partial [Crypturellus undulatus]|nr:FAKD4 protein [Crypturellus undulatus]
MAARLLRRCRWHHLGALLSAPSATPAALLVPAGKVAMTRALPRAPLASLHIPSLSSRADSFPAKEQMEESRNPEQKVVSELIEAAASPQELFRLSELHSLSSNQASLVITRLSRLAVEKHLETDRILQDEHFEQLFTIIDAQVSQVWNNALVNLLRSLYALGLDSSRREMRSIEHEVLWRLRRLSFRQLAALAELLALQQGKEGRLLGEVLRKLELRWTELEGTRTVVMLIAKVGHISPALMDRLEDKALELAEQFSPEEIRRIALALAYQNRRSVPLLRALSYHLLQKHTELGLVVLMDILFAYGKLNFHQPQVFQRIASELQPHVATMSPLEVARCVRSFALLKWLNLPLFEAITQYALDNSKEMSVPHLCSIIVSFARLNFQPSANEDFSSMVHEKLQGQLESLEAAVLMDVVWSLCVLQQARAPYLQHVLAPTFHAQLPGDASPKAQSLRLKLIHINAAARLESPGYAGPFLSAELLGAQGQGGEKATPLQSGLREALATVLGSSENGRFDVRTIYGWNIDAEMLLDGDNKPLSLKDFAAPHLLRSEGTTPLPAGSRRWVWGRGEVESLAGAAGASRPPRYRPRRVAFLRWEFPSFSNRSRELLGRCVMARRHVQAAGFLVVDVS